MKASSFLNKILSIVSKAKSIADLKNRMRKIKTRFMIYSLLSTDKKVLFGSVSHKLQGLIQDQNVAASGANQETSLSLQLAPILHNNMNATILPLNVTNVEAHDDDDDDDEGAVTWYHEEEEEEAVPDQSTTQVMEEEDINDYVISAHEDEINQENEGDDDDDNDKTKDIYPDLRHSLFEEDEYEMGRPGSVIELVKKTKEAQDGEEFKLEDQIDEVADLFIQRFHRHMWIQKQNSFKRRSSTANFY